jgi:hypothetical protein
MTATPSQLVSKASECGFIFVPSEDGNHCIQPTADQPDWCITYQKGAWVLMVKETPQVRFSYEEVLKFLNRFS